MGHADHVVDLHLAASPDAQAAMDAGIEVNRHRRMAPVRRSGRGEREKRLPVSPASSAQRQNSE